MPRRRRWNQPKTPSQEEQPQENNPAAEQNNQPRPNRRPRKNNQPYRASPPTEPPTEPSNPAVSGNQPAATSQPHAGRRPRRNNQGRRNNLPRENQPSTQMAPKDAQRNDRLLNGGTQNPPQARDQRRTDTRRSEQSRTFRPTDNPSQGFQQRSDRIRTGQPRTNQPRNIPGEANREQHSQPGNRREPSGRSIDNRRRDRQPDSRMSFPAPSVPIPTNRGIKARSQRGTFSKNWWARRWIEAMEQLVDPHRLQRGRSYARQGQVLSIEETQHGVEALVQGSRPQPYKVTMQLTPLTDAQWEMVINALAEQALFTARLLAGEMPENIEDAFLSAGVSLFPEQSGDLFTSCSCPDWANPCKHVAATHYILGDRFDDDPFLLFRMRGRDQEHIMQALRERRSGGASPDLDESDVQPEAEASAPLSDAIDNFWEPVESLDSFPLTIRPPTVDMPILKRLGEPAFIESGSLQDVLKPVYDTFTRSALRAAYSEEEPLETNNGHDIDNS